MSARLLGFMFGAVEFGQCPEDILEMIANHLTVAEILTARAVCRHWSQNMSKRYKHVNLPLEVDLSPDIDDWLHKLRSLQKLFPAVQSYQLYVGSRCTEGHLDAYVATLVTAQLTSLQVDYVGPSDAATGRELRQPPACMSYLTTLRVLKLHNGKWMGRGCVVRNIRSLTALKRLEELSIRGTLRWNSSKLASGTKVIKALACLTSLQDLTLQVKDGDHLDEFDDSESEDSRYDSNSDNDGDADEDGEDEDGDASAASLALLSRLRALRLLDGSLDVSPERLGDLSRLSGLSCLHLMLRIQIEDALRAVAALATITSLRGLDLVFSDDSIGESMLPAVESVSTSLPHMLTGLELSSCTFLPLPDLTQCLTRLSCLERLALLDQHHGFRDDIWDNLDVLGELSALRSLSSFSLMLSTSAAMVLGGSLKTDGKEVGVDSQSEYAVEQLCSTWGRTLTSLHLVRVKSATVLRMVAQLPNLRSLIVRSSSDFPLPTLLNWGGTQVLFGGVLLLPVELETLQLRSFTLHNTPEGKIYIIIWHFCTGFVDLVADGSALAGDGFNNEPCKAVAGALAQAAQQVVAAGGDFSPSVLAHLLALADGRRGVWQASMHLLQFTALRHLALRHCIADEHQLAPLLLSCPNLRSLDLSGVQGITTAVMAVIGLLTNLTSLILVSDPTILRRNVTEYPLEGVQYLRNLPYLRTLELDTVASWRNQPTSLLTAVRGLNRLYELRLHQQGRAARMSLATSLAHLPHMDVCADSLSESDSEWSVVESRDGDEDEEAEEEEGEGEDGGEGVDDYAGEDGAGGHDEGGE